MKKNEPLKKDEEHKIGFELTLYYDSDLSVYVSGSGYVNESDEEKVHLYARIPKAVCGEYNLEEIAENLIPQASFVFEEVTCKSVFFNRELNKQTSVRVIASYKKEGT